MFLIDLEYLVSWEEVQKHVVEHRAYLGRYYERGELLLSGPKGSKKGGIILSLQQELAEVKRMIAEDPFNTRGVAKFTITEFAAVKYLPVLEKTLNNYLT